jgi:hypothetical protein
VKRRLKWKGSRSTKWKGKKKPSNPEQEREAILKMIAEGRITPEEGDMLLEALGSIDPMC